jgi:hypothetical protein
MANYGLCISIVFLELFFEKKAAIRCGWRHDSVIKLARAELCTQGCSAVGRTGWHDLHLLNMKHHGVQSNLHSGGLGGRFVEEDGATRNGTPPRTATKYLRRPRKKKPTASVVYEHGGKVDHGKIT